MPDLPSFTPEPVSARLRRRSGNSTTVVVLVAVVALIAGYFAGREHLKYELRATMRDAFGKAVDVLPRSFQTTAFDVDLKEVREVQVSIAEFTVPEGMKPSYVTTFSSFAMVGFSSRDVGIGLMLNQAPYDPDDVDPDAILRESQKNELIPQIASLDSREYVDHVVHGQPGKFLIVHGKSPGGINKTHAVGMFRSTFGKSGVFVCTGETKNLSVADARRLIESLH